MSKQEATALLNFIKAEPDAFNAACDEEAAKDGGDGAALGSGIVDMLGEAAGETTEEGEEENA